MVVVVVCMRCAYVARLGWLGGVGCGGCVVLRLHVCGAQPTALSPAYPLRPWCVCCGFCCGLLWWVGGASAAGHCCVLGALRVASVLRQTPSSVVAFVARRPSVRAAFVVVVCCASLLRERCAFVMRRRRVYLDGLWCVTAALAVHRVARHCCVGGTSCCASLLRRRYIVLRVTAASAVPFCCASLLRRRRVGGPRGVLCRRCLRGAFALGQIPASVVWFGVPLCCGVLRLAAVLVA